jgi:hypothetical protein
MTYLAGCSGWCRCGAVRSDISPVTKKKCTLLVIVEAPKPKVREQKVKHEVVVGHGLENPHIQLMAARYSIAIQILA